MSFLGFCPLSKLVRIPAGSNSVLLYKELLLPVGRSFAYFPQPATNILNQKTYKSVKVGEMRTEPAKSE